MEQQSQHIKHAKKKLDARSCGNNPEMEKSWDLLSEFDKNELIKKKMLRILRPYCNGKNKSPGVCVDYLQIIPPSQEISTRDQYNVHYHQQF